MSITALQHPPHATVLVSRVQEAASDLAAVVATLDVGDLSGSEAAALTASFARIERLAAAAKTMAAGRVAATGWYRAEGHPTPQQWLADVTRSTPWEAGRVLETAAHLSDEDGLAATRSAFVAGSLTATQAHEVARTAALAPAEEIRLLALADHETVHRLKTECRKVRLADTPPEDPAARGKRIAEEMAFTHRNLGAGMSELVVRMPTSWLVLVLAAVRRQSEAVFAKARAEGRDDPDQAYLVEALVTLLLLGNLDVDERGGDDDGSGAAEAAAPQPPPADDALHDDLLDVVRGAQPPDRPPGAEGRRHRFRRGRCRCGGRVTPRAKIIIRVDQPALLRGYAVGDEVCDIAGVGPVPVATVRELWPDAVVKLIITRGVDVLNVTHLGRRATEAMATAMQFTMPSCSNIACDHDRFVEVDHRLGYANVRRTRLDELDPLCSRCHQLKTTENWQLVAGSGRRRFVPPDHPDHPAHPPTPGRPG